MEDRRPCRGSTVSLRLGEMSMTYRTGLAGLRSEMVAMQGPVDICTSVLLEHVPIALLPALPPSTPQVRGEVAARLRELEKLGLPVSQQGGAGAAAGSSVAGLGGRR